MVALLEIDEVEAKEFKKNYHIKAYEDQIDTWKESALRCKKSVSSWCRTCLDLVALNIVKPSFHETEMLRGRKSASDEVAISFQFRVGASQVTEWHQCAESEGLTIGEFCRQVFDHCATIELEK